MSNQVTDPQSTLYILSNFSPRGLFLDSI